MIPVIHSGFLPTSHGSVQALGGAKAVGAMLWRDKSPEDARRLLLDCLTTARSEKLKVSQVMLIFREAKQAGFHAGFEWFARNWSASSARTSRWWRDGNQNPVPLCINRLAVCCA